MQSVCPDIVSLVRTHRQVLVSNTMYVHTHTCTHAPAHTHTQSTLAIIVFLIMEYSGKNESTTSGTTLSYTEQVQVLELACNARSSSPSLTPSG